MDKGNKGLKDLEEIQGKASLAFIPAFAVTGFVLSTYLSPCVRAA